MSDIFLDFRAPTKRTVAKAADALRFFPDMPVICKEEEKFALALTLQAASEKTLWSPCISLDGSVFVAIAGKIALDEAQWQKAEEALGDGGLGCKAICQMYQAAGSRAFESLNGSYLLVVRDSRLKTLFVVTDGAGMYPAFVGRDADGGLVISSHPDVLADAIGCGGRLDKVSIAEFLLTGKVSFPHTYYLEVKALNFGSTHEVDLEPDLPELSKFVRHFEIRYQLDRNVSDAELAGRLASAFRTAVQKRVSPRFGETAVTLSGGMDSRAVLCAALQKSPVRVLCFFDEENFEYKVASRIAHECKVELVPLKRKFDHYGDTATLGLRIYGGMGNILNNHFLGFRQAFRELGIGNLLTGFYCDYLFKGLGLDRKTHPLTRLDGLSAFTYNSYRPVYSRDTELGRQVKERLEALYPPALRQDTTQEGRLEREKRRLFPLCYEPDHAETTVPQRVLPWDLPTVDADLLRVYLQIPPDRKLNCTVYAKSVELMCGQKVADIANANTGTRVGAQGVELSFHSWLTVFRNRFARYSRKGIAGRGSWPNWEEYLHQSPVIAELWQKPNSSAQELFCEILGQDPLAQPIASFCGDDGVEYFSRLLTLKVWLDGRR